MTPERLDDADSELSGSAIAAALDARVMFRDVAWQEARAHLANLLQNHASAYRMRPDANGDFAKAIMACAQVVYEAPQPENFLQFPKRT